MQNLQTSLFYDLRELIRSSQLLRKYYLIFKALNLSALKDKNTGVGANGYSNRAILRALIVKTLEQIKSISQLREYLIALPPLQELCGFDLGCLPDESKFYRFLSKTKNSVLKDIFYKNNQILIDNDIITLDTFILDSKPVMAATKENNFKNPNRNSRDKTKKPLRNPWATLCYYSCQVNNGKKENMMFFWGYRTHVIVSKQGICLVEKTLPNNITDAKVAMSLLKELKRRYKFKKGSAVIADKAYDVRGLYTFIVEQVKAEPFIPVNPRNQKDDKTFGTHGLPLCDAGLEMKSVGKWTEGNRDRLKFRCHIRASKKFAKEHGGICPVNNPKSNTGKCYGCTKYLDITDDARSRVPRDSKKFRETFKIRETVEQYFARLGEREAEQTTHYKTVAIKNQMTIAHLSLTAVAVAAAVLLKQSDKIRCYRTFAKAG
jgi:transposase